MISYEDAVAQVKILEKHQRVFKSAFKLTQRVGIKPKTVREALENNTERLNFLYAIIYHAKLARKLYAKANKNYYGWG